MKIKDMSLARFHCFVSLCLLCFSFTVYAQLDASIVTESIPVNKKYSADSAKIALENGTAELIVTCGTAPIYNPSQTRDFKKKYGVGYAVFGDMIDGTHCRGARRKSRTRVRVSPPPATKPEKSQDFPVFSLLSFLQLSENKN